MAEAAADLSGRQTVMAWVSMPQDSGAHSVSGQIGHVHNYTLLLGSFLGGTSRYSYIVLMM